MGVKDDEVGGGGGVRSRGSELEVVEGGEDAGKERGREREIGDEREEKVKTKKKTEDWRTRGAHAFNWLGYKHTWVCPRLLPGL